MKIKIKQLLQSQETGKNVEVQGWVRTRRGNKNVAFVALNDGSTIHNMQVVLDMADFDEEINPHFSPPWPPKPWPLWILTLLNQKILSHKNLQQWTSYLA